MVYRDRTQITEHKKFAWQSGRSRERGLIRGQHVIAGEGRRGDETRREQLTTTQHCRVYRPGKASAGPTTTATITIATADWDAAVTIVCSLPCRLAPTPHAHTATAVVAWLGAPDRVVHTIRVGTCPPRGQSDDDMHQNAQTS